MKKIFLMLFAFTLMLPFVVKVSADEVSDDELEVLVSQTTKYYKTVTDHSVLCLSTSSTCNNSVTYEVSKSEYDAFSGVQPKDATIETTYKRLVSSISTLGSSYYRYKAKLTWKNMPSTRSYDIIGIGFYQSVKILNNDIYFKQKYSLSGGSSNTTYSSYNKIFAGGAGGTFQLPTGSLTSLNEEFYFDVEKNTTSTIIEQLAASDYAHATSTISYANAKKFNVGPAGIDHLDGTSPYYDVINPAKAYWYGTW